MTASLKNVVISQPKNKINAIYVNGYKTPVILKILNKNFFP